LISVARLGAALLVASLFADIYSSKRQSYLLVWTVGWFIFGLHYLVPAIAQTTLSNPREIALEHWLYAISGLLFFLGAQIYAQRKPWRILVIITAVFLGLWDAANAVHALSVSAVIRASLLYIAVAVVFWQESRRQETLADRLLGISFAC